mgnify:CR=1 FL=1|tara:strand:- start:175 stop:933 length:759 start_codon:yes stop_codon:yes gene_type:complete
MTEVLILSLIQGITEFLPVSSSSHLILVTKLIYLKEQSLSIDVSLHIGSFIAVCVYFYKDLYNFTKNRVLLFKILSSSLPILFIGYLLAETNLIDKFRTVKTIGWTTLIFGILLYISDKFKLENSIEKDLSYKSAIIIGLWQVLALIPGVSRSGITITASRFLNFKRFDSAKISFLLSIPTLGAVSIFGFKNLIESQDLNFSTINLGSMIFSFFFSFLTIKYFLNFIQRFSLNLFIIYRVILGIIILTVAYS